MDMDLTKVDLDVLKNLLVKKFEDLFNLKLESAPDANKVQATEKLCEKLNDEITSRESKANKKPENAQGSVDSKSDLLVANRDYTSHKIKNMSMTIASEVPVFSSGHDVHIWLSKIDSYHKLYVAKDKTGVMEEHFIQVAKSRLCPEYLNAMMASSEDTSTYAGMEEYMKKHHASKMSVFQILDMIWEMDRTQSETFRDYGIRLDEKAAEARNIIEAKFKEYQNGNVSRTDKELKVDDVFRLMSGQVFLQSLKNKRQVIYNNICNDLDKTWSAAEIANKAMTFSDRMTSDTSQNQAEAPVAFTAQSGYKNNASRNEICYYFLKGNCRHGNKCKRYHDEKARQIVLKEKAEKSGQSGKPGSESGKFGSKPNKEDAVDQNQNDFKGSNQHQSFAVHAKPTPMEHPVTGMPMLPLPTQDFRI